MLPPKSEKGNRDRAPTEPVFNHMEHQPSEPVAAPNRLMPAQQLHLRATVAVSPRPPASLPTGKGNANDRKHESAPPPKKKRKPKAAASDSARQIQGNEASSSSASSSGEAWPDFLKRAAIV